MLSLNLTDSSLLVDSGYVISTLSFSILKMFGKNQCVVRQVLISAVLVILTLLCPNVRQVSGTNFKCPASKTVYHPCKCFTWDDHVTTTLLSSSSLPSLGVPSFLSVSSAYYSNESSTSQESTITESATSPTLVTSSTAFPSQAGAKKQTHEQPSHRPETEVEISCRTLETDEDTLKALFERLHQHIYENGYMKRFTSLRIENTALANIDGSDLFSGVSFQSLDFFQNIDLDGFSLKSFEASRNTLKTLLLQGSPFNGSLEFFEELSEFKRLETLILSNNHLTGLPHEVFGKQEMSNLSYIDLGGNRITTIGPKTFYKLPKLQRITLDNNFITNVTKETFIIEREDSKLLLIFLRNNNLTEDSFESGSFANMNQTVFLYLNSNQITHLREDIFKPILEEKNDLFIALWSNPFVCDCRSLWLLENKAYLRKRLHGFKCINFNKREIWDLESEELKCP